MDHRGHYMHNVPVKLLVWGSLALGALGVMIALFKPAVAGNVM